MARRQPCLSAPLTKVTRVRLATFWRRRIGAVSFGPCFTCKLPWQSSPSTPSSLRVSRCRHRRPHCNVASSLAGTARRPPTEAQPLRQPSVKRLWAVGPQGMCRWLPLARTKTSLLVSRRLLCCLSDARWCFLLSCFTTTVLRQNVAVFILGSVHDYWSPFRFESWLIMLMKIHRSHLYCRDCRLFYYVIYGPSFKLRFILRFLFTKLRHRIVGKYRDKNRIVALWFQTCQPSRFWRDSPAFLPDVPLNHGNVPLFVRSWIFFGARALCNASAVPRR